MAQWGKNLPAVQETQEAWVWFLGQEDPLGKEMATHSSVLAWETPWTGYSPWTRRESDTSERLLTHTTGRAGFSWGISPWLREGHFLTANSNRLFSAHVHSFSPPSKNTSPSESRTHLTISINLNYHLKCPNSTVTREVRASIYEFWRDIIQSIIPSD